MIDKSSETAQILLDLGAQSSDVVGQSISGIWDSYADKALIGPRLQSLYTYRAAVDILLGLVWRDVDTSDEQLTISLRQRSDHLSAIRERVVGEINTLLGQYQAARSPSAGALKSVVQELAPLFGRGNFGYPGRPPRAPWVGE